MLAGSSVTQAKWVITPANSISGMPRMDSRNAPTLAGKSPWRFMPLSILRWTLALRPVPRRCGSISAMWSLTTAKSTYCRAISSSWSKL